MPKYVNADKMLHELSFYADRPTKRAMEMIKTLPEEDVAPVVHGKWIVCGIFGDFIKCSNCDWDAPIPTLYDWKINYCPHCGAKMDKEEQDAEIH